MKPAPLIDAQYRERRGAQSPYLEDSRRFTMAHDGEMVVPLPEMDANETNTMANILKGALNQQAMRIAASSPDCFYPPTRPGFETHEKRAREKRQVTHGWWYHNGLRLKDRLRARWLIGYAAAPVHLRPPRSADRYRIPQWEPRSPLTAFPAGGVASGDLEPPDCIFATTRTFAWLIANYPEAHTALLAALPSRDKIRSEDRFEVLEYVDAEETVTLIVGESRDPLRVVETDYGVRGNQIHNIGRDGVNRWCVELDRTPNRAGTCTVVIPGLIVLGKPQGQYHGLPAMMREQAELWALQKHAIKRGIFAETWFVHGGDGVLVTDAEPFRGIVGEVQNGEIKEIRTPDGFANLQAIDRYSEMMRQEGLIPREYSGLSTSGTRTGRRGEQVMEAVVDFPIQESQELLAASREAEDRKAIAIAKAYTRKVSFYVPTRTAKGQVTYDARDLFDADVNHCFYSHAGINPERVAVDGLQMVGARVMARRILMRSHPLIEDDEENWDLMVGEELDFAALDALKARAINGEVSEADVAAIKEAVKSGRKELSAAIIDQQKAAQKRQAEAVPPDDPRAQAGLANEGIGAEQPTEAGPTPQGLEALLAQLTPPGQAA